MNTVIKGTKSINEFKQKKSELTSRAEKFYADHVEISEAWTHGEPVKTWYGEYPLPIFIEYRDGSVFCYPEDISKAGADV